MTSGDESAVRARDAMTPVPSPLRTWRLSWARRRGDEPYLALFLPGGEVRSDAPNHSWQPHILFVDLLARGCAKRIDGRIAVGTLQWAVQGWNGPRPDPVADLAEVLAQVRQAQPGTRVALIGHSMGGRAALWGAAQNPVEQLVLLAPWVERDDPLPGPSTRRIAVAHGLWDRVTPPAASQRLVERLLSEAQPATYVALPRVTHYLIDAWRTWRDFACEQLNTWSARPGEDRLGR